MTCGRVLTLFLVFTALYDVTVSQTCTVSSPSLCVSNAQSAYNALPTNNPTAYCEQGAQIIVNGMTCMAACNGQDPNNFFQTTTNSINTYCQSQNPSCPAVVTTYQTQTQCFNKYAGGLQNSLNAVFAQFQAGQSVQTVCQNFDWARNCQKQTTCQYNLDLDIQLIQQTPAIIMGLALCGSETTSTVAAQVYSNSGCSSSLYSTIESTCSVAVALYNAPDTPTFCSILQGQVNCFFANSQTCFTALQRYLLPRLDVYSMANVFFGCNVSAFGLTIKPAPASPCGAATYSGIINTCFGQTTNPASMVLYVLQQLCDDDIQLSIICSNLATLNSLPATCASNISTCIIPHAQLFPYPASYDNTYAINLGVYPLNVWGVTTLIGTINAAGTCPSWTASISAAQQPAAAPAPAPAAPARNLISNTPYRQKTPSPSTLGPTPAKQNGRK